MALCVVRGTMDAMVSCVLPLPLLSAVVLGSAGLAQVGEPPAEATPTPSTRAAATSDPVDPPEPAAAPSPTERAATEPSSTGAASDPAEPSSTAPSATELAATEPSATEPSATEPAATEPAATEPSSTEASAATTTEPSGADPPSAEAPAAATAEPSGSPSEPRPRTFPRLVVAGGPLVGPHAFGNEQCNSDLARCETKGSFFGVGAQVELRARLWRPLYLHLRGLAVGNVSPNDQVYRRVLGGGLGLGVYGRRAFGRAEYLLVSALGDNRFEPPFFDGEVATDRWGRHAGALSVGFRQPLPRGLSLELWGGPMFGPRSTRSVPQSPPDERILVTFQLGLNLSWDVLPARSEPVR